MFLFSVIPSRAGRAFLGLLNVWQADLHDLGYSIVIITICMRTGFSLSFRANFIRRYELRRVSLLILHRDSRRARIQITTKLMVLYALRQNMRPIIKREQDNMENLLMFSMGLCIIKCIKCLHHRGCNNKLTKYISNELKFKAIL